MRIGEVVGGAALVGIAVLVGIALTDDTSAEIITTDTSPFVFGAGTTTSTITITASTPTTAASPSTPSAPPATSTTTLIPAEQRGAIAVRVLNGGAPARAAINMSEALRGAGFAPGRAGDAAEAVDATRVIFAPGREAEAATVNSVVTATPENVVPASDDDPNWAAFGGELAVLVVLGPAGT